jgi:putative glutamine amidotransferase
MTRRRVGITMRLVEAHDHREPRNALSLDWGEWFRRAVPNATPIPLLNVADDIEDWIREMDLHAVILSGGNDWGSAPERDETERHVIEYALKHEIPILGTCRGLHALNVLLGGGLSENVVQATGRSHVAVDHPVRISDSRFALTGEDRIVVNSYHDHGVLERELSLELCPFAVSEDGVVEGAYHPRRPALAVQWHPERPHPSRHYDERLFERFFVEGAFWAAEAPRADPESCKPSS